MKNKVRPKSDLVKFVDSIQSTCATRLYEIGFIRNKRIFLRHLDNGLIQVLRFQLGDRSLYGKFTINMGVYIPEIFTLEHGSIQHDLLDEACCEIRSRVSQSGKSGEKWWNVARENYSFLHRVFPSLHLRVMEKMKSEILIQLKLAESEFYDRFDSREKIVRYFEDNQVLPFKNEARSSLAIAIIQAAWCDKELTRQRMLEIIHKTNHDGFRDHVIELMQKVCGNQ